MGLYIEFRYCKYGRFFFNTMFMRAIVLSYLGYIGIEEGVEYMFIGLKRERIILGFFFF